MNNSQLSQNQLQKIIDNRTSPYVFLETISSDKENKNSYLFTDFVDILTFNHSDDLGYFLRRAQNYLNQGYWLCGWFGYELGYYLEPALHSLRKKSNSNLAWLGVSKKPHSLDIKQSSALFKTKNIEQANYSINNIKPNISQERYSKTIGKIKDYLEQGLTYQVNYTFKIKFDFSGSIFDFYSNLRLNQPTAYAALIDTGSNQFISLSPELFFRIEDEKITARPMKGTADRGRTESEDKQACAALRESEKIQAENIMIVDLLRNDLGRISKRVRVPKIFEVEKYKTLHQMTSTIEAKLKSNLSLEDLFSSIFPSGSVTGAPKIKTMEIINLLEKEPRGIYTGSIGYIAPNRDACFNVAIRTIHLKGQKGELGVGGGIVYDSLAKSEYEEAMLKAKFFMQKFSEMSLIETISWEGQEYFLLELHLKRLKNSCDYFSIALNEKALIQRLNQEAPKENGRFKVRVLVDIEGEVSIEKSPLGQIPQLAKIKISSERTDSKDCFLYHKTTKRDLYDCELTKVRKEGFFEVIFLNTAGELTEGAITNLFIERQGQLYTPKLSCGLLPGVMRESLISQRKVKEKTLYLKDIYQADKIYVGNSVCGLIKAELGLADLENESKIGVYAKSNS